MNKIAYQVNVGGRVKYKTNSIRDLMKALDDGRCGKRYKTEWKFTDEDVRYAIDYDAAFGAGSGEWVWVVNFVGAQGGIWARYA